MVKDVDTKEQTKKEINKKLPKEVSQEIIKKIFKNLLKTVGIMLYFIILNLAFKNIKQESLVVDIQVFACAFLVVGIVFIEKAYKKDSGSIAINGIEFLVLALHSLSIMHITTLLKYDVKFYLLTSSYVFAIYYVLKSIFLYTKGRKDYLNRLSDISEIVKKDEPIKKEAKKRSEIEKNIEMKKEKVETSKGKPKTKSKTTAKKTTKKPTNRTKKEEVKEKSTEGIKTPKTKSKTKQEQTIKTTKKTTNKKTEEQTEKVVEKKKRGRPKKEVMKND